MAESVDDAAPGVVSSGTCDGGDNGFCETRLNFGTLPDQRCIQRHAEDACAQERVAACLQVSDGNGATRATGRILLGRFEHLEVSGFNFHRVQVLVVGFPIPGR